MLSLKELCDGLGRLAKPGYFIIFLLKHKARAREPELMSLPFRDILPAMEKIIKPVSAFFFHYQKLFFFLLTVVLSAFILFPVHDLQVGLAQGDHGRDLYAFSQTMRGAAPYQDYFWTYGPLMPYVYGLIFKVLGASIQSALAGEILFALLATAFFYLALSCFVPLFWASLAAVWFASFYAHFPHTFNHAGGVSVLIFLYLMLACYVKTKDRKFLGLGFVALVVLSLIKLNFGLCGFTVFLLSGLLIELYDGTVKQTWRFYLFAALASVGAVVLVHLWFIRGLALYYVLQCFSLLKSYQQTGYAAGASVTQNISALLQGAWAQIAAFWPFQLVAGMAAGSLAFLAVTLKNGRHGHDFKREVALSLGIAVIFAVLCLHEAFLTVMPYAKNWAQPFLILLIFLVITLAAPKAPRALQVVLAFFLAAVIWTNTQRLHRVIHFFKNPLQHFQIGRNNAYVTNSANWFLTIHQTVYFLNTTLGPKELFFALPYEPLYYFLTEKQSPTKEIEFFTFMNIPPAQEQEIIANLENKKVNYIVLSNRCRSDEAGLGVFGKDHCPLLARYILENFTVVASFGDWDQPAGWIENHAVRVLKRNGV